MEDMGFGDLVDYSPDTLDGIFTTLGELEPASSPYRGWELEQQLESPIPPQGENAFAPVPPQVDSISAPMPVGSLSLSLLREGVREDVGVHSSGIQIPMRVDLESSTFRDQEDDRNRLYLSHSGSGYIDLLSWLPELSNPPPFLASSAPVPVSSVLPPPLVSFRISPLVAPPPYFSSPRFHLDGRLFIGSGILCGAGENPIDPPVDVPVDRSATSHKRDPSSPLEEEGPNVTR